MDKFGIFKLLNSFFNFYGQKNQSEATDSSKKSSDNQDLLSNLINSLNSKPTPNTTENQPVPNQPTKTMPLQADMLKTINSHDAFIKRVKQKNPQ